MASTTKSAAKKSIPVKKAVLDKKRESVSKKFIKTDTEGKSFNSEKVYIHEMLDDLSKVSRLYVDVLATMLDGNGEVVSIYRKLQNETIDYGNKALSSNVNNVKQLKSCKSVPEVANIESDYIKSQLDGGFRHIVKSVELMKEISSQLTGVINRNIGFFNSKVKESCDIYKFKR